MRSKKHALGTLVAVKRLLILFLTITLYARCDGPSGHPHTFVIDDHGAIVRMDTSKKEIYLVFTGHEFAEGFPVISRTLKKHDIRAAFFFTGDFYRNPEFRELINSLKDDGHYLGAHSDKHLLYCSWEKRDSLLVTKEEFIKDVRDNYFEMERFGISKEDAPYFMPPYEWYNLRISQWTRELGLELINFTGGTSSNQDWTYPELGDTYVSSDTIFQRILRYEEKYGMNGFILLTHIGAGPERSDKFFDRLDELIVELGEKGYSFIGLP